MMKRKASSASSNKDSKCLKPSKDAMTAGLNVVTNKIEECKANDDGNMQHGTLVKIVSQNLVALPWLNLDQVNYFMQKLKKAAACSPFCEAKESQPTTKDMTLFSLTADDLVEADDASIHNLTTNDKEEVAPKSIGG